ncbi:AI-2E family transporter [Ectothiorhodospiraceae bacterium BW-2]|nr:AI-2E family transporter [Ectothiorhodospiraceae bacterium BW-2]
MRLIRDWFERYFSDPQIILLSLLLLLGFGVVLLLGEMLTPVLVAIVFAYLLDGIIKKHERPERSRLPLVLIVFGIFMALLVLLIFGLSPMLWTQVSDLFRESPNYLAQGKELLMALPDHYPIISTTMINELVSGVQREVASMGQMVLSMSLSSIPGIITLLIYLILVPLLVFFFLKDKGAILGWFRGFLPRDHNLSARVWREVDEQIGNYIRGKIYEIVIVGGATYIAFTILGVKYTTLLAVAIGLSVLVPYIGAAVVTIPVAVIGYFQWGWSGDFAWLMGVYLLIQALDGNILVPLLFSEVVNLHPVAIIVAILIFGGFWGFWGIFFAIPLATLVNAVISSWPSHQPEPAE